MVLIIIFAKWIQRMKNMFFWKHCLIIAVNQLYIQIEIKNRFLEPRNDKNNKNLKFAT